MVGRPRAYCRVVWGVGGYDLPPRGIGMFAFPHSVSGLECRQQEMKPQCRWRHRAACWRWLIRRTPTCGLLSSATLHVTMARMLRAPSRKGCQVLLTGATASMTSHRIVKE